MSAGPETGPAPEAEAAAWVETSELRGPSFPDSGAPPGRVIVFGAVPLAAALSRLVRVIGWRAFVVDPRSRFAIPERFPHAERVLTAWPEEAFAELGGIADDSSIAVLAHDPVLDDRALAVALRSPAFFIGAIGSRRTQEARRERLRAAGLSRGELDRLSGPLGLDLGALSAEETALSILAEMVAVRHGRDGGRLTAASGRVRSPVP